MFKFRAELSIRSLSIWRIPIFAIFLVGSAFLFGAFQHSSYALQTGSASSNLHWPLGYQLGDRVFIQMQVDNNRADGGLIDYNCSQQYTYDGHRGTDFTLYNFRNMDEGVAIYAVASGQVAFAVHNEFDRYYWPPTPTAPNGISIRGPGFDHQYWHLRKNSLSVKVGDVVERGQFLGYVGSSGSTAVPHLHFELWDSDNGVWRYRDPFEGECSTRPSMWADGPYEYPGEKSINVFDLDIFNKQNLQGNEVNNFFGEHALKDRPFRPVVWGADEQTLGLWIEFQGDQNELYQVRVLRPNGTEFASQSKLSPFTTQGYQWHVFYWPFASQVSEADFGTWTALVEHKGQVLKEVQFEVGETSIYGPRFFPLAGISYRFEGQFIRDTLSLSGLEGDVTFTLIDAPDFVWIDGDELVIPDFVDLPTRNTFFQVQVTDAAGRTDFKNFHLVDISKPFE